jgi:AraC family transcriptional regulator
MAHDSSSASVQGWSVAETRYQPNARIAAHYHRGLTLSVIFGGGYVECFGRSRIESVPFTAVLKPPGFEHENVMSAAGLHALYAEPLDEPWGGAAPELRAVAEPVLLTGPRVAGVVIRLRREQLAADRSGLHMEEALLELLGEATSVVRWSRSRVTDRWLSPVVDLLRERYLAPPTIKELAALAGVHPVYLVQRFRQRFGCTVGDYVRRLKIDHAARLLAGPLPVGRIALESGFADHSHLTRIFRRGVGITPSQYRAAVSSTEADGSKRMSATTRTPAASTTSRLNRPPFNTHSAT